MSMYDDIGRAIIFLRKQRGFTQERLALECCISVSYLRRVEHGTANPTIRLLSRISSVLEVELRNPFVIPQPVGALG